MRTFLVNKETGREFEIVGLDKATNQITLRTELATFADVYDKDKFKALGYDLVRREGDTPPIDTPPAPRAAPAKTPKTPKSAPAPAAEPKVIATARTAPIAASDEDTLVLDGDDEDE